jgi:hypothetical protein
MPVYRENAAFGASGTLSDLIGSSLVSYSNHPLCEIDPPLCWHVKAKRFGSLEANPIRRSHKRDRTR